MTTPLHYNTTRYHDPSFAQYDTIRCDYSSTNAATAAASKGGFPSNFRLAQAPLFGEGFIHGARTLCQRTNPTRLNAHHAHRPPRKRQRVRSPQPLPPTRDLSLTSYRDHRYAPRVRLVGSEDLLRDVLGEQVRGEQGLHGDPGPQESSSGAGPGSLEIHRDDAIHAHHFQQSTNVGRCVWRSCEAGPRDERVLQVEARGWGGGVGTGSARPRSLLLYYYDAGGILVDSMPLVARVV